LFINTIHEKILLTQILKLRSKQLIAAYVSKHIRAFAPHIFGYKRAFLSLSGGSINRFVGLEDEDIKK